MVIGLFLDGLSHVELEPESFFTTSHLVLYAGFLLAVVAGTVPVLRRHRPGARWIDAVPLCHGVTLTGVAVFGMGAVLDLVWHETIGIEVSNEALLSPTHLVLLTGAMLALSGPLRAGWRTLRSDATRRQWWPATISLALLSSIAVFFTSYLTPFGTSVAASFPSTTTHTHDVESVNTAAFFQLRETMGLAGIIVTTLILVVSLLMLCRTVIPPLGLLTAVFVWLGLATVALGEFRQWYAALAVALAGAVADLAARRTVSPEVLAPLLAASTWTTYFLMLALRSRLGWSPSLWVGSIVLSALIAFVIGLLAAPPGSLRASTAFAAAADPPVHTTERSSRR